MPQSRGIGDVGWVGLGLSFALGQLGLRLALHLGLATPKCMATGPFALIEGLEHNSRPLSVLARASVMPSLVLGITALEQSPRAPFSFEGPEGPCRARVAPACSFTLNERGPGVHPGLCHLKNKISTEKYILVLIVFLRIVANRALALETILKEV